MSKSFRQSFVSDIRGCCCRCCRKRSLDFETGYAGRRHSNTLMPMTTTQNGGRKNTMPTGGNDRRAAIDRTKEQADQRALRNDFNTVT
jgi:hypothetical protein